ncbi:MAG: NAD-dependent epimerase/dehydratase family protein [Taibaiella sp.]|nr:NAD-dependent epimerase/dehydratase family protein [Taibaiella sp.]
MKQAQTIVITGAAGFIGSVMVGMLNELGYTRLILVDDFSRKEKAQNLLGKKFDQKVHREQFF